MFHFHRGTELQYHGSETVMRKRVIYHVIFVKKSTCCGTKRRFLSELNHIELFDQDPINNDKKFKGVLINNESIVRL